MSFMIAAILMIAAICCATRMVRCAEQKQLHERHRNR